MGLFRKTKKSKIKICDLIKPGNVFIRDYPYFPQPRISFPKSRIAKILEEDFNDHKEEYKKKIEVMASYRDFYKSIPLKPNDKDPVSPNWDTVWISQIDGLNIYSLVASKNPRYFIECGSGNTTKFAARAIKDHNLRTKIISIDPYPRAEIDELCEKIYRISFENMDLNFFKTLSSNDIFLIDNSHRAFPNSDVTVFFTEVLPELPSGLIYGIHDIALPFEIGTKEFYNEQYMLATYIIGGAMGDSIYLPMGYLSLCTNMIEELQSKVGNDYLTLTRGTFFWMQKK